ncbi:MAG: ATP synthase F0 subunit B, partial [Verrucomicrobiota bacterium]|nr:ATP synthase F0 subunit B [Verrucomicrobiota bacterium]
GQNIKIPMSLIESTLILIAASGAPDEEMSVVEQFGFDSYKLIAQALTFVAVWFILKWKAYGPILEMLEKRKQRIAEGEENLKKIAEDLKDAEAKKSEIISEANAKAEKMISEARESAEAVAAKKREEAGKEAATIIAKAHEASVLEQEQLRAELKRDVGRLIIDTTCKVTGKVLTDDDQKKINEETASQVSL